MGTAVTCETCGAPVPLDAAGKSFTSCPYCHATLHLPGSPAPRGGSPPAAPAKDPRLVFNTTLRDRLSAGDSPFAALCAAGRASGAVPGDDEAVARATLALAYDFDKDNGTRVMHDVTALQRIAAASTIARAELTSGSAEDTEINLPFLCATSSGPQHLQRRVTLTDLNELSNRAPAMFDPPAAKPEETAPAEPEKQAKKGWWPFG